ncbi:B12-binding domain-containing radical SAM protein [Polluticoccus soli]|uniref:B12-binding domain-containing radical SAM protein n=1 Tax=Polluticoccus soli TaxID=3034150 RepID=UPI0023E2974D|nr:radical SAM protein [Flavipsychrobacter sp. JY13-12]
MKILLTHGYFLEEDPKELLIMKPYVPLGILYISAYLEKCGFENEVFDSTFRSFKSLTETIIKNRPDVIGIYTNLMTKINVLKIVKFIKSNEALKDTRIVLGGPEVRNHANDFLMYGADVIVFGEGEQTMLELVKCYAEKGLLSDVNGIAYRDASLAIVRTPERTLNKMLDQLPAPNRKKIDLNAYLTAWKSRHGYSAINLSSMRGCPYTCKWCSRAVYGQSYRRRKAALVVDEIVQLQSQYNFDSIWFVDDVFTVSHKWLEEFAKEIAERKVAVRYECISRADRLNDHAIELLKQSGCFRVWIGAESGSQRIIDAMDRRVDVEETRQMIQKVKAAGMEAGTFIMLGYPGETEDDIVATMKHLKSSLPDQFTITITYPIKGTPLYAEVEKDFLTQLPWHESTDRDIDFKREFPRSYYEHAVKWVSNEVLSQKFAKNRQFKKAIFCKITAWKYKYLMEKLKTA